MQEEQGKSEPEKGAGYEYLASLVGPVALAARDAALSPCTGFSAEGVEGYASLVSVAEAELGVVWTERCLTDKYWRAQLWKSRYVRVFKSMCSSFPTLSAIDVDAAVAGAFQIRLWYTNLVWTRARQRCISAKEQSRRGGIPVPFGFASEDDEESGGGNWDVEDLTAATELANVTEDDLFASIIDKAKKLLENLPLGQAPRKVVECAKKLLEVLATDAQTRQLWVTGVTDAVRAQQRREVTFRSMTLAEPEYWSVYSAHLGPFEVPSSALIARVGKPSHKHQIGSRRLLPTLELVEGVLPLAAASVLEERHPPEADAA